jgi:endonuclease
VRPEYEQWLKTQGYEPGTIAAQMYRAGRVETYYGNLDEQYAKDHLEALIQSLRYTAEDRRQGRPNPTKIPFEGNAHNNLASYRDAVKRYRTFLAGEFQAAAVTPSEQSDPPPTDDELGRRIGLERDMQAALRLNISQLEPGLAIIDEGAERSVDSGFIDITAKDSSGAIVVIELKTGSAGQRAIAQIMSYMGDVVVEEESSKVRGILIAAEFDSKARAAARVVPNLQLRRYNVKFTFSDGHGH